MRLWGRAGLRYGEREHTALGTADVVDRERRPRVVVVDGGDAASVGNRRAVRGAREIRDKGLGTLIGSVL